MLIELQVLCHKIPVDELVAEHLKEGGARIAVIDVVGMLPNVYTGERFVRPGERRFRVRSRDHFESASAEHEPAPA